MGERRLVYDTHEVAGLLGRHVNDVLRLIKAKRLEAKRLNIRGKRGRGQWVVTARELERFVAELPTEAEPRRRRRNSSKPRAAGTGQVIEIC